LAARAHAPCCVAADHHGVQRRLFAPAVATLTFRRVMTSDVPARNDFTMNRPRSTLLPKKSRSRPASLFAEILVLSKNSSRRRSSRPGGFPQRWASHVPLSRRSVCAPYSAASPSGRVSAAVGCCSRNYFVGVRQSRSALRAFYLEQMRPFFLGRPNNAAQRPFGGFRAKAGSALQWNLRTLLAAGAHATLTDLEAFADEAAASSRQERFGNPWPCNGWLAPAHSLFPPRTDFAARRFHAVIALRPY